MNATVMADAPPSFSMRLLERDLVPDWLIRRGIRALLAQRLREEDQGDPERQQRHLMDLIARLKASPIAINTPDANTQHYEVPTEFYLHVLGPNLKYSSCYYESPAETAGRPRSACSRSPASARACRTATTSWSSGCGWGSLSLWMAKHYPRSRIVAVSNSRTQKQFIDARARERGLTQSRDHHLRHEPPRLPGNRLFDRVVSVEMFEHMRNYETLLGACGVVDEAGGHVVRTHLHAQGIRLPLRGAGRK